jgi:hypothetical protein
MHASRRNREIWAVRSEMDGPDLTSASPWASPPSCPTSTALTAKHLRKKKPETLATAAAKEAAAMPPEGTRMAGLWEREVGRLRPKRFAHAYMVSQV